jgi:hypothetical protein
MNSPVKSDIMKRCPPGFVRIDGVCKPKETSPKSPGKKQEKIPIASSILGQKETFPTHNEILQAANPYEEFERIGRLLVKAWENRPDSPKFFDRTPMGLILEGFEEFVNLQFKAASLIAQGRAKGKNQYSTIERDRVETIGFKPIYSPGGFQV